MSYKDRGDFERGYDWAKSETAKGKTPEDLEHYLCGPDRNGFDHGAEQYLREYNQAHGNQREFNGAY